MADDVSTLILEHLRKLREVVDNLQLDVHDLKWRISASERHLAEMQVQMAGVNARLERHDERLGRMERRLELADA